MPAVRTERSRLAAGEGLTLAATTACIRYRHVLIPASLVAFASPLGVSPVASIIARGIDTVARSLTVNPDARLAGP